jgi:hypothetical protein
MASYRLQETAAFGITQQQQQQQQQRHTRSFQTTSQLHMVLSRPGAPLQPVIPEHVDRPPLDMNVNKRSGQMPTLLVLAGGAATALSGQDLAVLGSDPLVQSIVAAAAGVATVSCITTLVASLSDRHHVPAYDAHTERFDPRTFGGRYCHMLLACDPRLLFYSEEQVRQAHAMAYPTAVDPFVVIEHDDDTNRALWQAKRIADAALHRDTQDWIPRPFRMSGYLPFNGPICIAMLMASSCVSSSTAALLFWSGLNQSQNALVNYYNRNAATELSLPTLLSSYAIAVGSALGVAFLASHYVTTQFDGDQAAQLLRFVSFPSAVVASSLNCYIVRRPELVTGVPLLNDRQEAVLGLGETSLVAAAQGVFATTASRAILQMPTYLIPPLLLERVIEPLNDHWLAQHPEALLPVTTYVLLVVFGFGLPAAVGLFAPQAKIAASKVEEKYQHLVDPQTNEPYQEFTFYKGL